MAHAKGPAMGANEAPPPAEPLFSAAGLVADVKAATTPGEQVRIAFDAVRSVALLPVAEQEALVADLSKVMRRALRVGEYRKAIKAHAKARDAPQQEHMAIDWEQGNRSGRREGPPRATFEKLLKARIKRKGALKLSWLGTSLAVVVTVHKPGLDTVTDLALLTPSWAPRPVAKWAATSPREAVQLLFLGLWEPEEEGPPELVERAVDMAGAWVIALSSVLGEGAEVTLGTRFLHPSTSERSAQISFMEPACHIGNVVQTVWIYQAASKWVHCGTCQRL